MVPRTDHFAFRVADMDEAIQFYTEKLGLALVSREVNEPELEEFAFLALEGGDLELLQYLDGTTHQQPEIAPPYCPHLALVTEDMDATLERVRGHGIPIVKGPLEIANVVRWVYLSDPDHNVIEYIQWLAGGDEGGAGG